ncbi:hypothetical protein FPZ12_011070 [Amycolatopsis acidicola]|uniref:DUF1269 domain-containing protein n=1 Tax=Amycolatopsis acidicola TaxID=2596893 RepID=A0A5N0VBT6_9PSEU|nr:DUF6325 family protein [Amycolatopsis acidicola]KAA9162590.1 hypothetical protein FPZ12_011070 [Amycolatopsis acidicola]
MAGLEPIEVLVISFPGSRFSGRVIEELVSLRERNVARLVDALLVRRDEEGHVRLVEFEDLAGDPDLAPLADLVGDGGVDLVSADDAEELTAGLGAGDAAAVVVLEHTWFAGMRSAVAESEGRLLADVHVPDVVVDEVLGSLEGSAH